MSNNNSVVDYIATFPPTTQKMLQSVRKTIQAAAPEAQEGISYQMPTYKQKGVLCHFAGYEHHIGFYPTPAAIIHFKEEISKYKSAKGSVQFPLNEPMPLDLVKRMVEFNLNENNKKK